MGLKIRSGRLRIKPEGAVHEAGHVAGRYVTAEQSMVPIAEAVDHVETATDTLSTVTWGPWIAPTMLDGVVDQRSLSADDIRRHVDAAKLRGVDVEGWARAKVFQVVMGPMAEAKYKGKAFGVIWWGSFTQVDRSSVERDCRLAGVDCDRAIEAVLPHAKAFIEIPAAWSFILEVGKLLQRSAPKQVEGAQLFPLWQRVAADIPALAMNDVAESVSTDH